MKLSIITPSLNQGKFIRQCIESVLNQDHQDFEHIVVDAESNDETHSILDEYPHLIKIIGKDSGPANAINKGFKKASGEIIAWLNSDDYYEKNIFSKILRVFEQDSNTSFVYGDLTFVKKNGDIKFADKTKYFDHNSLINISPDMRQPSSFFKRELMEKLNYLNEDFKIVFDYELFIRLTKETKPVYIPENIAYYRDYEETITRTNIRRQAIEIFKASQLHGGRFFSPVTKLVIARLIRNQL